MTLIHMHALHHRLIDIVWIADKTRSARHGQFLPSVEES